MVRQTPAALAQHSGSAFSNSPDGCSVVSVCVMKFTSRMNLMLPTPKAVWSLAAMESPVSASPSELRLRPRLNLTVTSPCLPSASD